MVDSIFSYTDLPIMLILWVGVFSLLITTTVAVVTLVGKLFGFIEVSGYAAIVLLIAFFASAIISIQGVIGCYLWRAFENTKKRPLCIVSSFEEKTESE